MSDFKAKIHKIRFPLGLCPRTRWRSLQRYPDSLAVFKGPTFKGMAGEGKRRERGEERKSKEKKGKTGGGRSPNILA